MRILIIIMIGVGAFLAIPVWKMAWFFIYGLALGDCATLQTIHSKSPSNKYEAMVNRYDCGATGPAVAKVALRQEGDADTFEDVFGVETTRDVGIAWVGPAQLRISLPWGISAADEYQKETQWRAVSIEYEY